MRIRRSLHGRHVLITGASSGIGAAFARAAAERGARLTLVARRPEALEDVAASCAGPCFVLPRDLSEVPDPDWLDGAIDELGPVDVLVNNAGMEDSGRAPEREREVGRKLLRLNLEVPLALTTAMLPDLIERSGAVVNVSSVAALTAPPFQAWYSASKAGLAAYSESLRGELHGTGLGVLTVYPGPIDTPMGEQAYAKLGGRRGLLRLLPRGAPGPLAAAMADALERDRARLVFPRAYSGSRWFPPLSRPITDIGGRFTPVPAATDA
jgi:short-subunit dehydrogenase